VDKPKNKEPEKNMTGTEKERGAGSRTPKTLYNRKCAQKYGGGSLGNDTNEGPQEVTEREAHLVGGEN